MSGVPVAVQLYSVREDCEKDLPETLEAIAKMGYDGVEFAGYYGREASQLKGLLDGLGLSVAGTHTGWNTLEGDELERTMDFNEELGNRFLICPGLPEERRCSIAAWRETAALMNDMAERASKRDMQVGYHNHAVEFQLMDGETPWDVFFGNTREEVVMQLDTGNAMHGGGDVLSILKRFPGRATTIHLKEFSEGNDQALVGEGEMPWKDIFKLCETEQGTQWYIVEQETYAHPPLKCVELCLQNVRGLLE